MLISIVVFEAAAEEEEEETHEDSIFNLNNCWTYGRSLGKEWEK